MSRSDTINQKIRRNIEYLFKKSEMLNKIYPHDMVFSYIESWCHRILIHNDKIYTIDFEVEIKMLKDTIKANPKNKELKVYYFRVVKTNKMIKEKYKNKIPNPVQSLRQSLKEMGLMRAEKLPKRDIEVLLNDLDKEIREEK